MHYTESLRNNNFDNETKLKQSWVFFPFFWNMDSYFVYMLKMEYGFILYLLIFHLRAHNGVWIHTSFRYVLRMGYGFIFCLLAQNGIWIHTSFTCSKWNMDSYFV